MPAMRHLRNAATAMTARLTQRWVDFLVWLLSAWWVTTSQVQRKCFPAASIHAARRWLLRGERSGFVRRYRRDRMTESMFTLGPEGRRILDAKGYSDIKTPRKPPQQANHHNGVNDVRLACEQDPDLSFFYAAGELQSRPELGWKQPIYPDAIIAVGSRNYAIELDLSTEGIAYFVTTKIPVYAQGLGGFPLTAVLIIADRQARMESLKRAIANTGGRFVFGTLDQVRDHGIGPLLVTAEKVSCQPVLSTGQAGPADRA
jgi:protein involved in plasmid replication-relaxation